MSGVLEALSSPLKKYVTKILQSYLGKYIKDIELEGTRRGSLSKFECAAFRLLSPRIGGVVQAWDSWTTWF